MTTTTDWTTTIGDSTTAAASTTKKSKVYNFNVDWLTGQTLAEAANITGLAFLRILLYFPFKIAWLLVL